MNLRLLSCALLALCSAPLAAGAEGWKSPHQLEREKALSAALIPFPKDVSLNPPWLSDDCVPLNGSETWTLEGDMADSAMVQTAWQGLLSALPKEKNGQHVVCKLELSGDRLPREGQKEGYVLDLRTPGEVYIQALSEAGFFYGLQTLRQLLAGGQQLPVGVITDWPSFRARGFMHDCGRNFQPIESLKRHIDLASQLKTNVFHWHLADYPAYHLECRKYPQLNAPEHRTRDKADTYTYAQVRELIAFAKARNVTIIPEIDMPGHSDYFVRAFGFEMHSEQGMKVLEDILDEICTELPVEDCPVIHIGADEVSVPNAMEFIARMSKKLAEHGRVPVQWEGPWDLPVGERSIAQRWVQGKSSQVADSIKQPTVDSSIGYSNLMDPALLVRRWFFMQPCGVPRGDELRLGAIFCTWPDRRVEDKSLIPLQSPQWPGMCAMAERSWVGGSSTEADAFPTDMPAPDAEAARAFAAFEKRLEGIRHTVFRDEPFPYWSERARENLVVGPVAAEQVEAVRAKVLAGQLEGLPVRKAYGGSLYFHTAPGGWNLGMFSHEKPGCCVWVISQVSAVRAGEAPFMVGFDAPLRSHQYFTGVPEPGEWSRCGTRIWLNGKELKNPRPVSPNAFRREHMAGNAEMPLCNDEIWWTQEPTMLPLQSGENVIIIEQPYTDRRQSWSASLIPLFSEPAAE